MMNYQLIVKPRTQLLFRADMRDGTAWYRWKVTRMVVLSKWNLALSPANRAFLSLILANRLSITTLKG
ncbi:MAG: hypothetical protein VR65_04970 [Desulfobulbaceae bacterium BRH_c16a]|nr:MAG: hypothetical protein VR65_04970 [Desulfobulbaceae bacterium BRH_c16a]